MYGYNRLLNISIEKAELKVRDALSKEGFGVLTEIDVKETLKKRLGVEFKKYKILGACNPPFAYKALQVEKDIGLMMPCNVILYEDGSKTAVSVIRPTIAMDIVQNDKLKDIASEIEKKLKKVIDSI